MNDREQRETWPLCLYALGCSGENRMFAPTLTTTGQISHSG